MDWFPLYNSIRIAAVSTVLVFFLGIFAAHWIAKAPRLVKGVLDVALTLPLVLPPTVVGWLLLLVLGPRRPLGAWFQAVFGLRLTMTWQSAIFAAVAVSFPLMYRTARGAFESFDQTLAQAGRTLGLSNFYIFWRVQMPERCWPSPGPWGSTGPRPCWRATPPAAPPPSPPRSTSSGAPGRTPWPSAGCW